MNKNTVYRYSALYFIRSKYPLTPSLHFSFPNHLPLCLPPLDSFSKAHNHLHSYLYYPEILTCVLSVLIIIVHTWKKNPIWVYIVKLEESVLCICFMNENMIKSVQNKGVVFQKQHWAYSYKNRWNVLSWDVSLF